MTSNLQLQVAKYLVQVAKTYINFALFNKCNQNYHRLIELKEYILDLAAP